MRRLLLLLPLVLALPLLLAPAPAAADDEGGHLVFDTERHHFGTATQEAELHAEIGYRNEGDAPVEDIRVIPDCGCYGVTLSDTSLAPGASGTLSLTFRTLTFSGEVKKRLRVFAKGNDRQDIRIQLLVDVVGGVILDPGRVWFGDVLVGSTPEKTIKAIWHREEGTPFEVTSVEVPGHDFAISSEPYESPTWKGTAITIGFRSPPPLGMFSATALVRTTHPDQARLTLPLSANVTGRVWVQSRTVYFGWVDHGKGKRSRVLVKPFDASVDLGRVTARSRAGHVEVSVEPNPRGREGWWELLVAVPEDAPEGPLDDVIEVRTAVPGEEITEIEVRGEVLPLGR